MPQRPLTPKQARFVDEYLKDLNASAAALRSGYSAKTAYSIGEENLRKPEIQEMVAIRRKALEKIVHMTQEKWIRRIEWLSRANISKIMEWDETGVRIKASAELSEQEKWLISEISETKGKYGDAIRVKLTDKLAALVELGKALGYYPEKKAVPANNTINLTQHNYQAETDPESLKALSKEERSQLFHLMKKMRTTTVIGEGTGNGA